MNFIWKFNVDAPYLFEAHLSNFFRVADFSQNNDVDIDCNDCLYHDIFALRGKGQPFLAGIVYAFLKKTT